GAVLADLVDELGSLGRPVAVIDSQAFYRDASLRLEYGRTDVESFYSSWLDAAGLEREVLAPLGPGGDGSFLPSLRDPATNRSTRAARVPLSERGVLLVVGELLLGDRFATGALDFDLAVHFAVSRQSRRRQFEERYPDWAWTLPAFDRYDLDVDPSAVSDVLIRFDDARHPALAVNRPARR
ncbi:MAG: uridine kinase, partial [Frankiales bacterium]|nr:uridine kinase [Frankiales bacterium]